METVRLTAVMCGRREPEGWAQGNENVDFFDLKGVAESLLAVLHVPHCTWEPVVSEPFLHPGKACTVRSGEKVIGTLGEVHPKVLANFDIDAPVLLLDFDLEAVIAAAGATGVSAPFPGIPMFIATVLFSSMKRSRPNRFSVSLTRCEKRMWKRSSYSMFIVARVFLRAKRA